MNIAVDVGVQNRVDAVNGQQVGGEARRADNLLIIGIRARGIMQTRVEAVAPPNSRRLEVTCPSAISSSPRFCVPSSAKSPAIVGVGERTFSLE